MALTWRPERPEPGMVTAETAVLLPLLAVVMMVSLWVVILGYTQVRLVDAARDVARLVARGTPVSDAIRRESSGSDAQFSVRRADGFVIVDARHNSRSPIPGLSWPQRAHVTCVDES